MVKKYIATSATWRCSKNIFKKLCREKRLVCLELKNEYERYYLVHKRLKKT